MPRFDKSYVLSHYIRNNRHSMFLSEQRKQHLLFERMRKEKEKLPVEYVSAELFRKAVNFLVSIDDKKSHITKQIDM